ncbi:hypothetical protein KY331_02585 [Candidatus Woesearchaeota archaeon]|nr:hypothetical protein [Candidatus Woesearchaeota archaeon]
MVGKKKQIEIISPKYGSILKFDSMKRYLKKKVVSKSGEAIGKTKDVLFDKSGVKGIIVAKRIFKKFYLDSFYFSSVQDKIMLSIDPAILLAGKLVFDADGKKLGKVIRVIRRDNTNNFQKLLIKRKIYSKAKEVPKIDIDVMKKNIILKKVY